MLMPLTLEAYEAIMLIVDTSIAKFLYCAQNAIFGDTYKHSSEQFVDKNPKTKITI